MPNKLQKQRRKYAAMMIYEIEWMLLSSKVGGDDCWQEKNSKGFKKRLRNLVLNQIECIIRDKLDWMRNVVPTNENTRIQRAWRVNTIDS